MMKKYLYILEVVLIGLAINIAYDWIRTNPSELEPKIVFILLAISLVGFIIKMISLKENSMECPYDSERLHKNQKNITNITLERLKKLFLQQYQKDLTDKLLVENIGDNTQILPVIILTKKEIEISKTISDTIDTNKINNNFIDILTNQCGRKIWNNTTYRLMSIDEQSNTLRLGESDYYKTLSTCDIHYHNFMMHNNKMVDCKGKEYETWFSKLINVILYNQFTTVSASLGCSTLLVVKNYKTNKFQYYIVDNSIAKNAANTKHVVPSFMFQPTKKITNIDDLQLQSNIQTQVLKEFGEELLGMHELERIDNNRELEISMNKNKTLKKLKKLLEEGKATLKVLGVSLDIFRLRPELLTILIIEDEKFFNKFHPQTSWEVSSTDKDGLAVYNIDNEERYLQLMFDENNPLVSPATACLKLGREYVLSHYK